MYCFETCTMSGQSFSDLETECRYGQKFLRQALYFHTFISRVSYQNGISLQWYIVEIYCSGQKPSICVNLLSLWVLTCSIPVAGMWRAPPCVDQGHAPALCQQQHRGRLQGHGPPLAARLLCGGHHHHCVQSVQEPQHAWIYQAGVYQG